ncbi:uncharacterized protein LOC101243368 isoform X1 [Ciona intestinalis]
MIFGYYVLKVSHLPPQYYIYFAGNLAIGASTSFCLTYPNNCIFRPLSMIPRVNVPYCQRIPCSRVDFTLDHNYIGCITTPGCQFDYTLYRYRGVLNQAVLPGVPVCYLAVRNTAYLRRVHEHVSVYGSWNPLMEDCLLNHYRDEIFGPNQPGCHMVDVLNYYGDAPKLAGWKGITSAECFLIGACWKADGRCVYPVRTQQVALNTSTHNLPSGVPSITFYGQPKCQKFNETAPSAEFLSQHHQCLKAGCTSSVDHNLILQHLYTVMTQNLPVDLQYQFWVMAQLGQVRADNWKQVADTLKAQSAGSRPIFSNFQSLAGIVNGATNSAGTFGVIPFRLNVGSLRGNSSTNPRINFGVIGSGLPGYDLSSIASLGNVGLLQQLGLLRKDLFERNLKVPNLPCHYQNIVWPSLPPLNGSFEGCCDRERCFTPRFALYTQQYSGVASYLVEWSVWSTCSKTCDGGSQTRKRHCVGKNCALEPSENRSCGTQPCPVWLPWSQFLPCSKTCGGGVTRRIRLCRSGNCTGSNEETQPCRTGACPSFGTWSTWTPCSVQCGVGFRFRNRTCLEGGEYGCPPITTEAALCHDYCGTISYTDTPCNATTCYATRTFSCLKEDGSPGFCRPNLMIPKEVRCYINNCYCVHFPDQIGCVFRSFSF